MKAIILAILLCCAACTPPQGAVSRPFTLTNPEAYLKRFPLNTVTQGELIEKIGPPTRSVVQDNKTYLTYEIKEGWEYTYVLSNGVVTDVRFYVDGPYGGTTARKQQGLD